MAVERIQPYVIVPGIKAGFTAAGLPIISPSHPVEPTLPQPATSTSSPSEPSIPSTLPSATTPSA